MNKAYPVIMELARELNIISDNPCITVEFEDGKDYAYSYDEFINAYETKDILSRVINHKLSSLVAVFPIERKIISALYTKRDRIFGFKSGYNIAELASKYFAKTNAIGRLMEDDKKKVC